MSDADTKKWLAIDLPVIDYETLRDIQLRLVSLKKDGVTDKDFIFFTEHFPVFTIGKNGKRENFLVSEKILSDSGIKILHVERGGDITYHGNGQLIVYPVIDLKRNRIVIKEYVAKLEEAIIKTAADMGVEAYRVENAIGVWADSKKIGSIGIAVKKEIAFHGIALNIDIDLEPFEWINPCGLKGVSMTSIAEELGSDNNVDMILAKRIMKKKIEDIFGITIENYYDFDRLFRGLKISSVDNTS